MEAAAFFAVAEFRRVQLAQILYGGDDVGGEDWDRRDWQSRQTTENNWYGWLLKHVWPSKGTHEIHLSGCNSNGFPLFAGV
jgi:hypothetical protein